MSEIKFDLHITVETKKLVEIAKTVIEATHESGINILPDIKKTEPTVNNTTVQEPETVDVPWTEDDKPAPTLEEIRALLAGKSRSGHSAEVKALISKYGANKLSEVPQSSYAEIFKEAEEIGNAK